MNKIIKTIVDFENYTWEDWGLWVSIIALIGTIVFLAGAF